MSNKYRGISNTFAKYQWFRYWRAGVWHQIEVGRFGATGLYWVTSDELLDFFNHFKVMPKILKTEKWLG